MARNVTRATLLTRVRRYADMENGTLLTDAEIEDMINEALCDLYDILIEAAPPDYYASQTTLTTSSGTTAYSLPSDFYKIRSVWVDEGNGEYRPLGDVPDARRQFYRAPAGAYSVLLNYIPTCSTLASSGSTFDGVNGWDKLVTLQAAIQCKNKEESDPSVLAGMYVETKQRIISMANRDPSECPRVKRSSLRNADSIRAFQNTIDGYHLRAGNLELVRYAGIYAQ